MMENHRLKMRRSDAMYSSGVTSRHNKNRYESKSNKRKYIKKNDEQNGQCMPTKIDYLNSRIRINISGKIFEVPENILNQYPLTLLGCYEERIKFYDYVRDEFFFDRNREAFEGIIQFYQTRGILDIPYFVPIDVFYEELKFFKIDSYLDCNTKCDELLLLTALKHEIKLIKQNLKNSNSEHQLTEDKKSKIKNLRTRFHKFNYYIKGDEDLNIEDAANLPKNKYQLALWTLIEKPNSSTLGRMLAFFGLTVVILSVIVMCMETVVDSQTRSGTYEDTIEIEERNIVFFVLEFFCNSVFTIEFCLRFIASPNKIKFLKNFLNFVDIIAVVPFWTVLIVNNHNFLRLFELEDEVELKKRNSNQYALSVLRILRLTRVLRVLKLSRHIQILNVMGKILYECIYEIVLLLTFLTINIIIFSSLIYYIELDTLGEKSPFISIPHSFWWAIISFTTIGYGDLIPQSTVGKVFGSFFIVCGILIALLPVPILSCKFEKIYKECSYEKRKNYED